MPETSTVEKLKWADHPYIHSLPGLRFPKNDKWKDLFPGRSLELFGSFFYDWALDNQRNVEERLIDYVDLMNKKLATLPKGASSSDGLASKVDLSLTSSPYCAVRVGRVESLYRRYLLRDRLDFVIGIMNLLVFARDAFVESMEAGPALPPYDSLANFLDMTILHLRDRPLMLLTRSTYGFLRDEIDTKSPASEASSDDKILTPSTSNSASVADIEEPVRGPISTSSIQSVVRDSSQSLDPGPVQRSLWAICPPNSNIPPPPITKKDNTDSTEAKEDVLGKYKEMSSRIDRLEQENRQLQTCFVTEQTLNTRTTLSLQTKEKELCMVQEAFWKLWEAHRRQLNSGLEANGMGGLSWGANDAGIFLCSLNLGKDS